MKLLLDTQVLLWAMASPQRLPGPVREQLQDGEVEVFVSVASCWEIAIKYAIGKLPLPAAPAVYLPPQLARHRIVPLPVGLSHVLEVGTLPAHHSDPFDRLLIVQARVEGLHTITSDRQFEAYAIPMTLL